MGCLQLRVQRTTWQTYRVPLAGVVFWVASRFAGPGWQVAATRVPSHSAHGICARVVYRDRHVNAEESLWIVRGCST